MIEPLVSIITVVYNGDKNIKKTIESVINQTYKNIEYIVIDGKSTDDTVEIIKTYANFIHTFISEKDNGIYDAMNKGIAMASGEWIGFLNSDDYYELDCVENVVHASIKHSNIDIFHGLLRITDFYGNVNEIIGHNCSFLNKGMIEHPTCFIKKNVYVDYGNFNLSYKSSADYELILRFRLANVSFFLIEKILANFKIGGASSSTRAIIETLRIKQSYNLISPFKKYCLILFYKIIR